MADSQFPMLNSQRPTPPPSRADSRPRFGETLARNSQSGLRVFAVAALTLVVASFAFAQAPRSSPPVPALPQTFFSSELPIRVVPVATGLSHPWSLAFLPDPSTSLGTGGVTILVTEREGRLRIVRNGKLDPAPIAGTPQVFARVLAGLLDVALHPRFAENHLIYLRYSKAGENNHTTTALARGVFDGKSLNDVQDIFVSNSWSKSNTN